MAAQKSYMQGLCGIRVACPAGYPTGYAARARLGTRPAFWADSDRRLASQKTIATGVAISVGFSQALAVENDRHALDPAGDVHARSQAQPPAEVVLSHLALAVGGEEI